MLSDFTLSLNQLYCGVKSACYQVCQRIHICFLERERERELLTCWEMPSTAQTFIYTLKACLKLLSAVVLVLCPSYVTSLLWEASSLLTSALELNYSWPTSTNSWRPLVQLWRWCPRGSWLKSSSGQSKWKENVKWNVENNY